MEAFVSIKLFKSKFGIAEFTLWELAEVKDCVRDDELLTLTTGLNLAVLK